MKYSKSVTIPDSGASKFEEEYRLGAVTDISEHVYARLNSVDQTTHTATVNAFNGYSTPYGLFINTNITLSNVFWEAKDTPDVIDFDILEIIKLVTPDSNVVALGPTDLTGELLATGTDVATQVQSADYQCLSFRGFTITDEDSYQGKIRAYFNDFQWTQANGTTGQAATSITFGMNLFFPFPVYTFTGEDTVNTGTTTNLVPQVIENKNRIANLEYGAVGDSTMYMTKVFTFAEHGEVTLLPYLSEVSSGTAVINKITDYHLRIQTSPDTLLLSFQVDCGGPEFTYSDQNMGATFKLDQFLTDNCPELNIKSTKVSYSSGTLRLGSDAQSREYADIPIVASHGGAGSINFFTRDAYVTNGQNDTAERLIDSYQYFVEITVDAEFNYPEVLPESGVTTNITDMGENLFIQTTTPEERPWDHQRDILVTQYQDRTEFSGQLEMDDMLLTASSHEGKAFFMLDRYLAAHTSSKIDEVIEKLDFSGTLDAYHLDTGELYQSLPLDRFFLTTMWATGERYVEVGKMISPFSLWTQQNYRVVINFTFSLKTTVKPSSL